jgi:hypothetical protein
LLAIDLKHNLQIEDTGLEEIEPIAACHCVARHARLARACGNLRYSISPQQRLVIQMRGGNDHGARPAHARIDVLR